MYKVCGGSTNTNPQKSMISMTFCQISPQFTRTNLFNENRAYTFVSCTETCLNFQPFLIFRSRGTSQLFESQKYYFFFIRYGIFGMVGKVWTQANLKKLNGLKTMWHTCSRISQSSPGCILFTKIAKVEKRPGSAILIFARKWCWEPPRQLLGLKPHV